MLNTRRLLWMLLILGLILAISMSLWLLILYSGKVSHLPNILDRFGRLISDAQDLPLLKDLCLKVAEERESERISRLNFLLVSAGVAIGFGLVSAAIAARLLYVVKPVSELKKRANQGE